MPDTYSFLLTVKSSRLRRISLHVSVGRIAVAEVPQLRLLLQTVRYKVHLCYQTQLNVFPFYSSPCCWSPDPFWTQLEASLARDEEFLARLPSISEPQQSPWLIDEPSHAQAQELVPFWGTLNNFNPDESSNGDQGGHLSPTSPTLLSPETSKDNSQADLLPVQAVSYPDQDSIHLHGSFGADQEHSEDSRLFFPSSSAGWAAPITDQQYKSLVSSDATRLEPTYAALTLASDTDIDTWAGYTSVHQEYEERPTYNAISTAELPEHAALAPSYLAPHEQTASSFFPAATDQTAQDASFGPLDQWTSPGNPDLPAGPLRRSGPPHQVDARFDDVAGNLSSRMPRVQSSSPMPLAVATSISTSSNPQMPTSQAVDIAVAGAPLEHGLEVPNQAVLRPAQKRKRTSDDHLLGAGSAADALTSLPMLPEDPHNTQMPMDQLAGPSAGDLNSVDTPPSKKQRANRADTHRSQTADQATESEEGTETLNDGGASEHQKKEKIPVPCDLCFRIFTGSYEMKRHRANHCKKNPNIRKGFTCTYCGQHLSRKDRDQIARHRITKKCLEHAERHAER
ncbi:hypothetical protein OE88DRAFT_1789542 [Heliocybe sulcata]|uniref:C2H2-type domain-containing protein n=1 Tax=Heliocybe sulcata TaxID=5364 RepID=A0A5C3N976_9AGAM|nr:hypothetical protein OE88DRAFT_1789542 [Heliocybe sulcata]